MLTVVKRNNLYGVCIADHNMYTYEGGYNIHILKEQIAKCREIAEINMNWTSE